jgi:tubulin-specific chaperone E
MSWPAIMDVVALMPRLKQLESGYNRLQNLSPLSPGYAELVLSVLNLDSNQLSSWVETCQALTPFQK